MKNSHQLRTWRNKIGRDTKIQEKRIQVSDSLFSYAAVPFAPINNLIHNYEGQQKKLSGRHKDHVTKSIRKQGYADYNYVQVVQPLNLIILESKKPAGRLRELQKTVFHALVQGLTIKAVGSGHSYSDITTTNDCLILTEELKKILRDTTGENGTGIQHDKFLDTDAPKVQEVLDSRSLPQKSQQRFFYEFESGIKIYQLNEELEKEGLALDNMGTYQGQSFIGAASTGTHGSGIELGALPEMICSICLVADGGIIYRIESKTNRITKRGQVLSKPPKTLHNYPGFKEFPDEAQQSFQDLIDQGEIMHSPEGNDVILIQNDEWFNAAKLNVGCFGIVYSIIIEVGKAYDIIETIEFDTWKNLKARLADTTQYADLFEYKDIEGLKGEDTLDGIEKSNGKHRIRHTEILVNPYPDGRHGTNSQAHYCRILRRYISYETEDLKASMKRGRVPGDFIANIVKGTTNTKAEGTTVAKNKKIHWFLNNNVIFRIASGAGDLFHDKRTKHLMELAKGLNGFTPSDHLDDNDNYYRSYNNRFHYRNRGWKVFPAGGDKIGGYGAEMAFPFRKDQTLKREDFITAVDKLLALADLSLREGGHAQTVPYSLRFVAPSKAPLSPQYSDDNTPTCMIELLNLYDTVGGKELLRRYQLAMLELGGRPHWGLDMNVMSGFYLERLYPKIDQWIKTYHVFNAFGSFNNAFTHRMGWSIKV